MFKLPSGRNKPSIPLYDPRVDNPFLHRQQVDVEDYTEKLSAESRARKTLLTHRTRESVLDAWGTREDPSSSVNVVTFTVPEGAIALVEKVAICYSHPTWALTQHFGWQIRVNDVVPGNMTVTDNSASVDLLFNQVCPSLWDMMEIEPMIVQARETVALRLVVTSFTQTLVVCGRIAGRVLFPASPALG